MIYTAVNKTQAMLESLAENYTSQKIRDKKDIPDPSAQREGYSQNGDNGQHRRFPQWSLLTAHSALRLSMDRRSLQPRTRWERILSWIWKRQEEQPQNVSSKSIFLESLVRIQDSREGANVLERMSQWGLRVLSKLPVT